MVNKSRRGRPVREGADDERFLAALADVILSNPAAKIATEIKRLHESELGPISGNSIDAIIHRLREAWHRQKERLLRQARMRKQRLIQEELVKSVQPVSPYHGLMIDGGGIDKEWVEALIKSTSVRQMPIPSNVERALAKAQADVEHAIGGFTRPISLGALREMRRQEALAQRLSGSVDHMMAGALGLSPNGALAKAGFW